MNLKNDEKKRITNHTYLLQSKTLCFSSALKASVFCDALRAHLIAIWRYFVRAHILVVFRKYKITKKKSTIESIGQLFIKAHDNKIYYQFDDSTKNQQYKSELRIISGAPFLDI